MILRDYQLAAIEQLRPVARKRPILVAPTGSGKTVVAAHLIRLAVARGSRVLFIAHRRELIDQAVARLAALDIRAGVILSGRVWARACPVQVASIQTLARRELPPAEIVIVDEAHHVAEGSQYTKVLAHYASACVIGLTATPFRLDGKGLGYVFGAIVAPVSVADLVARGVIVDPVVYSLPGADLRGVRSTGGDYNLGQLEERVNKRAIVGDLIEHWQRLARHPDGDGRRTVVFAVTIAHSQAIVERFREAGIAAEHVDMKTPNRGEIFRRLASGETRVVSNVGIVTEGWDLPSLEVAVIARPTKSLCLHLQMIGRIMRSADGKQALVLDHAGNHQMHGPVTAPIEYSLTDHIKRDLAKLAPLRVCKFCYCTYSGPRCPACGREPEVVVTAPIEEIPGELVRYTADARNDRRARYARWIEQATEYGKSLGWARHKYKEKFGMWPGPTARDLESAYRCPGHDKHPSRDACRNCYAPMVGDRCWPERAVDEQQAEASA